MTNTDKSNRAITLKLATILVFTSALAACTAPPVKGQAQLSYEEPVDDCPTLNVCLAKMYEVACPPESKYSDISAEEFPVAERIAQFGDPAVARVVPLLRSANEDIAQIAALILREVEHIDEKYLPDIVQALNSDYDLDWLPPALGRINSDSAASEAVKRLLVSRGAPDNQEGYAVILWRKLPGAPLSSWLVDTGELLINTRQGGSILVAEDGTMRMAPCHQE